MVIRPIRNAENLIQYLWHTWGSFIEVENVNVHGCGSCWAHVPLRALMVHISIFVKYQFSRRFGHSGPAQKLKIAIIYMYIITVPFLSPFWVPPPLRDVRHFFPGNPLVPHALCTPTRNHFSGPPLDHHKT